MSLTHFLWFCNVVSEVTSLHENESINIFSPRILDNAFVMFVLIISGVFWLHRLVKFIYNVCCYLEIRSFYVYALKMTMVRQTNHVILLLFIQIVVT